MQQMVMTIRRYDANRDRERQMQDDLTEAQRGWLGNHPQYDLCGHPRLGISFRECGTLYADGRFEPISPMKVVKLEQDCRLIGIPSDLYLTDI
jgi:hypothetical protein